MQRVLELSSHEIYGGDVPSSVEGFLPAALALLRVLLCYVLHPLRWWTIGNRRSSSQFVISL